MSDQSFDARRMAREQENRIAAAAAVGASALKPLFQFQASLMRLWADNIEFVARNYERGLDTFSSTVEQTSNARRDAA